TDSAASFDVTSAPATNSKIVHATTKLANRCTPGLYLDVIASNSRRNYTSPATPPENRRRAQNHFVRTEFATRFYGYRDFKRIGEIATINARANQFTNELGACAA